ncbi:hypothetical protein R9C00_06870 [Flammeovirgaceae bacterium SG7u.111]|nr:hypothetical protein [Flammeovirgaceae bacterium SG7u.132]WPO37165.1 hypothetical protein R9C00_06870 [Flammeovirgaceae bacterium SG7u.111]
MTKHFLSLILFIVSFSSAFSQNKNGEVHMPETFEHTHIVIREVVVTGNKLTKENIVTRELDFRLGDSLAVFEQGKELRTSLRRFVVSDSSEVRLRLNYSRDNIINTKIFMTVDLYLEQVQGKEYKITIDVTERHYWWVFPVMKLNAPNFNEWLRDVDLSQLSMGLFASHNNLFGSSHQASIAGYAGKSKALALGYRIPWVGKGQKKSLTIAGGYNDLAVVEYASVENKRQIIYDNSSSKSTFLMAKMDFRPGLYSYNTVKLSWQHTAISDSLFTLNPNFLANNKTSNSSFTLFLDYYYDSRNNKSYPLEGNLLRVFLDKQGLGIGQREVDLFYYGIDFHFYQKISEKFYVAEMIKAVNSTGENAPYSYQQSLNHKKDFIRGFDLYTVKGDQMYYFRSNLKYELVKPNVKKVKPGEEDSKFKSIQYAFYLNLLADAGYVVNNFTENNPLNNKGLFSWGLGLDFVTYYDLVLRFEYTFNSVGTRGFFIGFGAPI